MAQVQPTKILTLKISQNLTKFLTCTFIPSCTFIRETRVLLYIFWKSKFDTTDDKTDLKISSISAHILKVQIWHYWWQKWPQNIIYYCKCFESPNLTLLPLVTKLTSNYTLLLCRNLRIRPAEGRPGIKIPFSFRKRNMIFVCIIIKSIKCGIN